MMTKKTIRSMTIIRLLIFIPIIAILLIVVSSCSGRKKISKTQTEAAPLPPAKQEAPADVFTIVEEMPVFPGGEKGLMEFIYKNTVYPKEAKEKNIQGRVIARFVVKYDGTVGNVEVLKGVDPALDNEAIRVIKMMPAWQPGKQGGKPVNVWYSIPITYSLSSEPTRPSRYVILDNDTVYTYVKEMPQFPGGKDALTKFRNDNIKYPAEARNAGFGGMVFVSFIVGKDGTLSDFSVTMGVTPSIDAEVLRVAKLMPPWLPGKENGRVVKVQSGTTFKFEVNQEAAPKDVFVVVEEMPQFPGGDSTLIKFIYNNIQYPKSAKDNNIQGRVILRFCVNYLGGIEQIGVLRGVDPALDEEAIRVIKMLPKWQPGKQGGEPVNVWYSVPVTFSLSGPEQPKNPLPQTAPPPPPPPPPLMTGYDEPPLFPGGESALVKFIESVKKYPQEAKDKNTSGTVKIRYTITETGNVDRISIMSSVDPSLDTEAKRVVSLMPAWQPGKYKGKPVKVWYSIPITFSLK